MLKSNVPVKYVSQKGLLPALFRGVYEVGGREYLLIQQRCQQHLRIDVSIRKDISIWAWLDNRIWGVCSHPAALVTSWSYLFTPACVNSDASSTTYISFDNGGVSIRGFCETKKHDRPRNVTPRTSNNNNNNNNNNHHHHHHQQQQRQQQHNRMTVAITTTRPSWRRAPWSRSRRCRGRRGPTGGASRGASPARAPAATWSCPNAMQQS